MILNHPTGSYIDILPDDPEDSTSIVYTVSSNDPPRSSLDALQVPTGITNKPRNPRTNTDEMRRESVGALALVSKKDRAGLTGSGNQLFYVGQVLAFTTSTTTAIEDINSDVDVPHDRHYIDAASVGLTDTELDMISVDATEAQSIVLAELETLQKRKNNLNVELVNQQKIINEADRVISGLDTILSQGTDSELQQIRTRMVERKNAAETEINEITTELDAMPEAIRTKHDELRSLSTIID